MFSAARERINLTGKRDIFRVGWLNRNARVFGLDRGRAGRSRVQHWVSELCKRLFCEVGDVLMRDSRFCEIEDGEDAGDQRCRGF